MLALIAALCAAVSGCRRQAESFLVAQTSGTIAIDGLTAPVRVIRDRWGVPHIYARTASDLFIAQGFVQAQDRLFQMDLWRRAAQGRLSEVLGANFIERDAMTRRMQFRGDRRAEWASYGPDAEAIASAFVRGVNAWADLARAQPLEMFALAGWTPDLWTADDLLDRTDAFVESASALRDVERQHLSDVVADAIRRAGARPFLTGLARRMIAAPPRDRDRELFSLDALMPVSPARALLDGQVIRYAEAAARFEHPSPRYLVHLNGGGWNVAGVTSPWRPGVAVGHNTAIAWASAPMDAITHRVHVESLEAAPVQVVKDTIPVKGREEPFEYETELMPSGVVVATDKPARKRFVLDWAGFETGAAPELAALAIDRASTASAFDAARERWKLPARRFVYADVLGRTESEKAPAFDEHPSEKTTTRALFSHPLALTDATRARFNVGPLARPAHDQQVQLVLDPQDWDRSRAMSAPGQSESPDSPHFSDLAATWSSGQLVPLVFSDAAVQANAAATLTLVPRAPGR